MSIAPPSLSKLDFTKCDEKRRTQYTMSKIRCNGHKPNLEINESNLIKFASAFEFLDGFILPTGITKLSVGELHNTNTRQEFKTHEQGLKIIPTQRQQ